MSRKTLTLLKLGLVWVFQGNPFSPCNFDGLQKTAVRFLLLLSTTVELFLWISLLFVMIVNSFSSALAL